MVFLEILEDKTANSQKQFWQIFAVIQQCYQAQPSVASFSRKKGKFWHFREMQRPSLQGYFLILRPLTEADFYVKNDQ